MIDMFNTGGFGTASMGWRGNPRGTQFTQRRNVPGGISAAMIGGNAPSYMGPWDAEMWRQEQMGRFDVNGREHMLGDSPEMEAVMLGAAPSVNAPIMNRTRDVNAPTMGRARDAEWSEIFSEDVDVAGRPELGFGGVDGALVGQSDLQAEMERQALRDMLLEGRLSAGDEREAQQTARRAFADRGMGRSNAAIFSEAMNRDRFSRERRAERRGFAGATEESGQRMRLADQASRNWASGVNAAGDMRAQEGNLASWMNLSRFNAEQGLLAGMANQGAGLQASLANQQTDQGRNLALMQGGLRAALANQETQSRESLAERQSLMQARLANQSWAGRYGMANQAAGMQANLSNQNWAGRYGMADQAAGLQAALANQGTRFGIAQANQGAQMQAWLANQGTQLGVYGIDRGIDQQQWDFNRNWQANQDMYDRDLGLMQQMLGAMGGGGGSAPELLNPAPSTPASRGTGTTGESGGGVVVYGPD